MSKTFVMRDGNQGDAQIGTLTYDQEKQVFSMNVSPDVPLEKLALSLELLVYRFGRNLTHQQVLLWIKGRICPPSRQNIREILKFNNMKEYREFDLLSLTLGRCDKDEVYLEPVKTQC